jgi:RHS repeat-associated protein
VIIDKSGQVVFNADYFAFGTCYRSNRDFDEEHGFTGKEWDPDIGLYYYNARWYDPELGRFISEDPAADPNNPNLYSYCANSPVMRTDPTGEIAPLIVAALIGGLFKGIDAALNGGNFWSGFIVGAFSGAIGYGFGQALTGTALANTLGPIGTQALTTGLASGTMAMLMVGDFWQGAFTGAISGGISAWLSSIIPVASYKSKTGNMILNGIRNAFINAFSSFVSTGEYSFQASDALELCGAENAITEALKTNSAGQSTPLTGTIVDSSGNVVWTSNNGDLSVYVVNADGSLTKIGETLFSDTFKPGDHINIGVDKTEAVMKLAKDASKRGAIDVAMDSMPYKKYDVKRNWGASEGYLLAGIYCTGEDIGNYLAGLNARNTGVSFNAFQRMAGAVHQGKGKNGVIKAFFGAKYGPSPMYGEIMVQYRMSIFGYYSGYEYFQNYFK